MTKIILALLAVVLVGGAFVMTRQDTDSGTKPTTYGTVTTNDSRDTKDAEDYNERDMRVLNGVEIDLSAQGLTAVPDSIFTAGNVQKLDVSHNLLTGSLPGEIRFLQALKELDLSDNNFTGVPAEIGQLKNLEVLDLSNNQLTGLPQELGNLGKLQLLNLKGNAYSKTDLEAIKAQLPDTVEIVIE